MNLSRRGFYTCPACQTKTESNGFIIMQTRHIPGCKVLIELVASKPVEHPKTKVGDWWP